MAAGVGSHRGAGAEAPRRGDAARLRPASEANQTLGVWTLGALVWLLASGVPMALVYQPDPATAHAGVERLTTGAWQVLRGAHAWAASAAVALALVHVVRGYVSARIGVIGRGRALAGLATLAVVWAAFFSGTILPWDQQGWEAFQHGQLAGAALGVGAVSNDPDATPLGVMFWGHVLAVPILLALGLAWHLAGRTSLRGALQRVTRLVRSRARSLAVWGLALVVAGLVWPPELGPAPLARLTVSRPDWPFLWLVPLQEAWGAWSLWTLPLLFVVAAGLIVRGVPHDTRTRRVVVGVLALCFGGLTMAGWL